MTAVLVCALLLSQPNDGAGGSAPVEKYLRRCEEAKRAALDVLAKEIKALEEQSNPTDDGRTKLQEAQKERKRVQASPVLFARLPLPPMKDDLGVFAPIDKRLGRSVDVLEVVDEDDVIVRAWYWTSSPLPPDPTAAEDATFVDLWIHGVDTSRLTARMPARLPQVFRVTGNQLFDTACGKRSLLLLEPVDLASLVPRAEK